MIHDDEILSFMITHTDNVDN